LGGRRGLARDINPKVFSAREWKAKLRERNSFVLDVVSKKKIFLVGDANGLAELEMREEQS
jgi:hypothetical protein